MKYTLIVECERCGKKAVFEADTDKKSDGGVTYNQAVGQIAGLFCGMTYVAGLERQVCEKCKAAWEMFVLSGVRLNTAFRRNEITRIEDADWG